MWVAERDTKAQQEVRALKYGCRGTALSTGCSVTGCQCWLGYKWKESQSIVTGSCVMQKLNSYLTENTVRLHYKD